MRYTIITIYISLILFEISFIVDIIGINSNNIIIYGLMLVILYICIIFVLLFFKNMLKNIYWVLKGNRINVLLIFPFMLIYESNKIKINININFMAYFYNFYPNSEISKIKSDKDYEIFETKQKNALLFSLIAEYIVFGLTLIYLLIERKYLLSIFLLSFIIFNFCLDTINTNNYHGDITKIENIKNGLGIFYVSENLILYDVDKNYIYKKFQYIINNFNRNNTFCLFTVRTIKHLFMDKIFNNNIYIADSTKEYIYKNFLNMENIDFTTYIGSEIWDFLKVLICYSLLVSDEMLYKLNIKLNYLENNNILGVRDIICWYEYISNFKRILPQKSKYYPNTIIRINNTYQKLYIYKSIQNYIIKRMYDICSS